MFEGSAEDAMNQYVSLFQGASVVHVERYGPNEAIPEGTFKLGKFEIAGHKLTCFDSPTPHAFKFTPSISIFVNCDDEAELDNAFQQLAQGGEVLMPLDNYGFSQKYGWVNDRFGVSWQLNLEEEPE